MIVSKSLGVELVTLADDIEVRMVVTASTFPTVAWFVFLSFILILFRSSIFFKELKCIGFLRNILATTGSGSAANQVIMGAHLDSVDNGPGINDNGSGVAALLTIATTYFDWMVVNKNK